MLVSSEKPICSPNPNCIDNEVVERFAFEIAFYDVFFHLGIKNFAEVILNTENFSNFVLADDSDNYSHRMYQTDRNPPIPIFSFTYIYQTHVMTTNFDIIKLKFQAALGNVKAMYILGSNYLYGIGVDVDLIKAHSYLYKAKQKGFIPAKNIINAFANLGESTELDPVFAESYEMLRSICHDADKGKPEALYCKAMGKLSDNTNDFIFNRGVNDMALACEQGYAPALFSLGMVYYNGNRIYGRKHEGKQMIFQSAEKNYIPAIKAVMDFAPSKAYPIIKRLAQTNNPDGDVLCMLSQYYIKGQIVEKDTTEGIRLLKEAAKKESIDAIFNLGIIYESGLYGVTPNIEKAVKYYEYGSLKEDPDCMNNLGHILEMSEKYPHDFKRAFELYSKAAEQGNGRAYNNLGTCYKRAIGIDKDAQKAIENYEKAIKNGCMEGYWNLYLYYIDDICTPRDLTKAIEWLIKGDQAGMLQCTYQLSKHYMNGDGVESNAKKYFECLYKASNKGFEEAYYELGDCYRYGIWTERNDFLAFEWYKKAAVFSIPAIWKLASCYINAIGTEKDNKKAFELYKIAAELGYAPAQYDLGICYRQGEGVEKDPLTAISWYIKAAEQGHGGAMNNLGIMYDIGIGVDVNYNPQNETFLLFRTNRIIS